MTDILARLGGALLAVAFALTLFNPFLENKRRGNAALYCAIVGVFLLAMFVGRSS
jgi:hypothetical protein